MAKKYLITSALPYVNNNLHIGHLIGCLLPSDVYARFCRAMGRDVLYIGGSDEHGTPSEIGARKENMTVEDYVDKYRAFHIQAVQDFNLSFDRYGRTHTKLHEKLIHKLFLRLQELDMIEEKTSIQPYSVHEKMFLADRYVIGTCPKCSYERAYGNECEKCGSALDPSDLISPHSAVNPESPVEMRETKHLYFKLSKMQAKMRDWIDSRIGWPKTATAIANKWLDEGLHDNPITRDLKWGIPVNKEGFEDKVFYVWFDAPWGYVSISQAANENWESWWKNPDTHYTQFMGKDNVSFHAVFFPAQELAMADGWKTVDVLKAVNFMNFEGAKISKSSGNGIFLKDAIHDAPADVWRYALLSCAPESDDTDFTISRFVDIVNKDLNGMLGNFVSRVCKLTEKNFGLNVPACKKIDSELADKINSKLSELTDALEKCELRLSIMALRGLWAIGNEYMTEHAPWALVKDGNLDGAKQVLNECFQLIDLYARVSAPFIPNTSEKILAIFNQKNDLSWPTKYEHRIPDDAVFSVPENLFERIDDDKIKQLSEKYIGGTKKHPCLTIAKIEQVSKHPERDNLHVLLVNNGTEKLQIVCGAPNVRVGLTGVLAPIGVILPGQKKPITKRTVGGVESNGMMCSGYEIGENQNSTEIIELDNSYKIGDKYEIKH